MAAEEVCEKCGGSGWIIHEREGISAAEKCSCVAQRRAEAAVDSTNIPPHFLRATFETFSINDANVVAQRSLGDAQRVARTYAREYPQLDIPGLLFIGDTGCGKTHLAVSVLRRLVSRGFEGMFFDFQNLLDRIRASYDANAGEKDREVYRLAMDVEILLIDDLGAHRAKEWVEDVVTSIITHRYNYRKPTIITTNLADAVGGYSVVDRSSSPGQLQVRKTLAEVIGMRARSRLLEMCRIVRMTGVPDYRERRSVISS